MSDVVFSLADVLSPNNPPFQWRQVKVVSVQTNNTMTVEFPAADSVTAPPQIAGVKYFNNSFPAVGKQMWLARLGLTDWIAVGSPADKAPLPICSVRRGATTSVLANTATQVNFNSSIVKTDPYGWYDTATPTRVTPDVPGWYMVSGGVSFPNETTTDFRQVGLLANGDYFAVQRANISSSSWIGSVSSPFYADGTTYFELDIRSAVATSASAQLYSQFLIVSYMGA